MLSGSMHHTTLPSSGLMFALSITPCSACSVLALLGTLFAASLVQADAAAPSTMIVVAHQDDDLLMLYPDLHDRLDARTPMATVYLTNGNAGLPCREYTRGRELGIRAVHAALVGVANEWTDSERLVRGKLLRVSTLVGTQHTLWFFGFPNSPEPKSSLEYLWSEPEAHLSSMVIDGRSHADAYSAEELIETLAALMAELAPEDIRTLDASGRQPEFYPFEHTDHVHGALFSLAALQRYGRAQRFSMYRTYNIQLEKKNLPREIIAKREALFRQYAQHDQKICETGTTDVCGQSTPCFPLGLFLPFMARRYTIEQITRADTRVRTRIGRCLTTAANESGAVRVTTARCRRDAPEQRWSVGERGQLRQHSTGRCVAAEAPKLETELVLRECSDELAQRFYLMSEGQLRGPNASCVDAGLGDPELQACGRRLRQTGWRVDREAKP
jgi:LmbE family N-acetylglucosaminyl deacetylase